MLSAYIDESERDENYYFLGAGIVNSSQHAFVDIGFHELLAKHAKTFSTLDVDMELHGNEILAGRKEWKQVPLRARFAIFGGALSILEASGICIHLEGIDINKQKQRYWYPTPARELALSHLLERINEGAIWRSQSRITAYADEHHTKETSRSSFKTY